MLRLEQAHLHLAPHPGLSISVLLEEGGLLRGVSGALEPTEATEATEAPGAAEGQEGTAAQAAMALPAKRAEDRQDQAAVAAGVPTTTISAAFLAVAAGWEFLAKAQAAAQAWQTPRTMAAKGGLVAAPRLRPKAAPTAGVAAWHLTAAAAR